jgi:NAD(P)-dependent dehydrogenase (short-subunit alcohol dehydrogenase family)
VTWTEQDVPDQTSRTVVVTGASAGLGLENTRALAAAGARVIMATRDARKTEQAAARIRRVVPGAILEHVELDLADLSSVRDAVAVLADRHASIDVVIANAGLMATPERRTVDGFELQIGVNHLGHAAFVAGVLPVVRASGAGRVVIVSSEAHRIGQLDVDDLHWERRRYQRWAAYGQSKLANLLYLRELARRLEVAGAPVIAAGAHPGYARTELQTKGPAMQGGLSGAVNTVVNRIGNAVIAQSPARGALPQLLAATAPDVPNGSYWGPQSLGGARGAPGRAGRSRAAKDDATARALWERTEELTGVSHDLPG